MKLGSRLILSALVGGASGKELVAMDTWIPTGKPITVVDLMLEGAEVHLRNCGDVDDALTVEKMSFDRKRLTVDVAGVLSRDVIGGKVVAEAGMVSASNGTSMSARVAQRLMLMATGRHKREQTLCAHLSRTMPGQMHSTCSLRIGKVEIPFDFNKIPSKVFAGKYSIRTRVADERGKPVMCFEASLVIPRGPSGEVLRQLKGHTTEDCERLRRLANPQFFQCAEEKCPDAMKWYMEEIEPRMESEDFRKQWSQDEGFVADKMKGKEEGMRCLCKSCETMAAEWAPSSGLCRRFIGESYNVCADTSCPDGKVWYEKNIQPRIESNPELGERWGNDIEFVKKIIPETGGEEMVKCACDNCHSDLMYVWPVGRDACGIFGQTNHGETNHGETNHGQLHDGCTGAAGSNDAQPIASLRLVTVLVGSMMVMIFHERGPRC